MNWFRFVPAVALAAIGSSAAFADVAVWFAPSAIKVMRDERPKAESPLRWELAAARNEVEGCQLVLLSGEPVRGVTVTVSDLRGANGSLKPALFKVEYVPCGKENIPYPDPLPPLRDSFDLVPGRAQPVWISVRVPKSAAPGVYKGSVTASRRFSGHEGIPAGPKEGGGGLLVVHLQQSAQEHEQHTDRHARHVSQGSILAAKEGGHPRVPLLEHQLLEQAVYQRPVGKPGYPGR